MSELASAGIKRNSPDEPNTAKATEKAVAASPSPTKRQKEGAFSPNVAGDSGASSSGALTKSKKNKNAIFDKYFDKQGQSKALSEPAAGGASKENKGRAANGADDSGPLIASLRKEILELGGDDIEGQGWTVAADSPAKGGRAKNANVKFISPQGKVLSRADVLKHLGVSGMSRDQCFKKAQQFKDKHPIPCTIGNIKVLSLGTIMVEKGLKTPLFHREDCIMPIGFKSVWRDPETEIEYTTEIKDGMDELKTNSLACAISWLNHKVVTETIEAAWQTVRLRQMAEGSKEQMAAAKAWDPKSLVERVGLCNLEIRKRIEGMRGAIDCLKYRFVNERHESRSDANGSSAVKGSPSKAKNSGKVQGKLTFEPAADGKKKGKVAKGAAEPAKSPKGQAGAKGAAAKSSDAEEEKKPAIKIKRTGKSALQIFSKEIREQVKQQYPELADKTGEINKIINRKYKELSDSERASYEARSTREVIRITDEDDAETEAPNAKAQSANAEETAEDEDQEKEKESQEEDLSMWHRDGSEYLGKRGRRYVFDGRHVKIDAVHGVIAMWLPLEEADYLSEETGEPAALWKIVYDDPKMGTEDLEESEVQEAIALMDEELPEKIKEKIRKREEKWAEIKAKKQAALEAKLARQQAKLDEKEKKAKEKDDRAKGIFKREDSKSQEEMRSDVKDAPPDESTYILKTGPYKGKPASAVKQPQGTNTSFPPPSLVDDFLPVFMFLRDLSGQLGSVRKSFEDLRDCITSNSKEGLDGFCEIAKWLTEIAVRSKWVRDEDAETAQELDGESMDVMDVTLAPGPLLNAKSKDNISYSPWQMITESSWPELARMLIQKSCVDYMYKDLQTALGGKELDQLSMDEKLSLLRFLCDEACSTDKVQRTINAKLRQMERILDKKRQEDAALRRREQYRKQQEKKGDAGGEQAAPEAEAVAVPKSDDAAEVGTSKAPLTAVQAMTQLYAMDPQPFTVRYKAQDFEGVLDPMSETAAVTCNGQTFATPLLWVKYCQNKDKVVSIKSVIHYKGKNLKQCEEEYNLKASMDNATEGSKIDLEMLIMEEAMTNVDTEKRSREIKAALHKASKGLRHEPIGYDRWKRSYFCFDGVTDMICACDAPSTCSPNALAASTKDWGYDGEVPEVYKRLNAGGDGQKWTCYSHEDGSLKELCDVLLSGPKGPREAALIEAMRENGITKGFDNEAGKAPVPETEQENKGQDDGFDWAELPNIGDVVWAKLEKGGWAPVKLVEPPGESPAPERDDASDEEVDADFQTHGSHYLGKRVRIKVTGKREEEGVVRWYLPVERADFVSEHTGKPAALWRVKFDDAELTTQDLEEFEVRAAMVEYAKAEAQRRSKNSCFLSSKSMFGQDINWVFGQLFTEKEIVNKFLLQDVQPYAEFRDIRIGELRRANKSAVLRQVSEANLYLEERNSLADHEQELKVILQELRWSGTSEQQMSEELKSSCYQVMRYPRILNVVQDSREKIPYVMTVEELKAQLKSLYNKIGVRFVPDDTLARKLSLWLETVDDAVGLDDVLECMRVLETLLNEKADEASIEAEESLPIDLDEWQTEGHEYIGKRLTREIKGRFGHREGFVNARVVGWLPTDESDYQNSKGEPTALWHILREDGDEEDLEDYEVQLGMQLLIKRGDHPDQSRHSGMWSNARDRERWNKFARSARTTAAASLALYLVGDVILHYTSGLTLAKRKEKEEWDEYCLICGEGGQLLCCDHCPRTVHAACLGLAKAPKGDFFCFHCEMERDKSKKPKASSKSEEPSSSKAGTSKTRGSDKAREGGSGSKRERDNSSADTRGAEKVRKTDSKSLKRPETQEELENLRRLLVRNGALNGSVAEVQPDAKALKRDERWFVTILDGDVINKKENPSLKLGQFFTEWRPRKGDRIKLDTKCEPRPVEISSILSIGAIIDILDGSERKGYLPVDLHL